MTNWRAGGRRGGPTQGKGKLGLKLFAREGALFIALPSPNPRARRAAARLKPPYRAYHVNYRQPPQLSARERTGIITTAAATTGRCDRPPAPLTHSDNPAAFWNPCSIRARFSSFLPLHHSTGCCYPHRAYNN